MRDLGILRVTDPLPALTAIQVVDISARRYVDVMVAAAGCGYDIGTGRLRRDDEAVDLWIDTAKEFGDPIPERKGDHLMLA